MSKQIEEIELDQIVPSPTNPRKYFNEQALKDLAVSIKATKGVIQAVTVRPHPTIKNKYELVCGERRYRASGIAEMATISSVIKDLTDEEVQELQFIENIEREDVHPMDEAVTFKAMIENKTKPWTVDDIAAKINKPASYVAQRLQLNHLLPKLQKEFWDGKFLVGHAILFARLTEADQKQLHDNYSVSWNGTYKPVKDVAKYIETNVMCKLAVAPFDKEDATLVATAGACSTCHKRTGNNPSLFADLKTEDRCTDRACFNLKSEAHLITAVEETLSTKPDVFLLKTNEPTTVIKKMAERFKVNILSVYDHTVSLHKMSGYTKLRGMYVSGEEKGKIITFYRKMSGSAAVAAKAAAGEKVTAKDIDEQIKAINQRLDRSKELDYEKEQEIIVKEMADRFEDNSVLGKEFSAKVRQLFTSFLLFDELHLWYKDELATVLFLDEKKDESYNKNPELLFTRLQNLNMRQLDTLVGQVLMKKYTSVKTHCGKSEIMRKFASFLSIPIEEITLQQAAAREKREANAAKKIAALQKQKEDLSSKRPTKAAKKTALGTGIDALLNGATNAVKKSAKKAAGKNNKKAAA